ncbi:MAG: prepilin-type N-terminal cleavage/methylation domain-containing protein [Candidatus Eremiobacterota bacterium]
MGTRVSQAPVGLPDRFQPDGSMVPHATIVDMGRKGVSLVELLVVLALLGLLLGLGVLGLRQSRGRATARGLAESVAQEFVAARMRAQATGTPVAVAFPSQGGAKAHSQALYVVEGATGPRVTRVASYAGDFPKSVLFNGFWTLTSGANSVAVPSSAIRSESFDVAAWGPPTPRDPCFVFLPSGALASNGQVHFGGAYHVVACQGVAYSAASLGGTSTHRINTVGECFTISVSLAGDVTVTPGLASGAVPQVPEVVMAAPAAAPPVLAAGPNGDPVIELVDVFPLPNPDTLPAGIDATVDLGSYLTLRVRATDPDGDRLSLSWTCDDGTVSSVRSVAMTWDGAAWEGLWEWRPPLGAPVGSVFTLNCQVDDDRGGRTTADLGASGRVEVVGGGQILFMSDREGASDLFTMNPDGTDVSNLTRTPTVQERFPVWSPDGTRIAYVAPGNGTNGPGVYQVHVMNADGTGIKRLTDQPTTCQNLAWTADGTQITFCVAGPDAWLWRVNADGTNPQQLFSNPVDGWVENCWSPDGTVGLVARVGGAVGNQEDIFLMYPNGTLGANVTALNEDDEYPNISPDGLWVSWNSRRSGNYDVWIAQFDGTSFSGATNLTNAASDDRWASWAPDGQKLVFSTDRDGNQEIYVVDRSGTLARLTDDPARDQFPCWRP